MTTSSNEGKKNNVGLLVAALGVFIYTLFTALLLGGLGHFPNTKSEFLLLGVFLYSLTCSSWLLALGEKRRPGVPTFLVGFAGMIALSYGIFFA